MTDTFRMIKKAEKAPRTEPVSMNTDIKINDITIGVEMEVVLLGFDMATYDIPENKSKIFEWARDALTPMSKEMGFAEAVISIDGFNYLDRTAGFNIQNDTTIAAYVDMGEGLASKKGLPIEIATPILKDKRWMVVIPRMIQDLERALPAGASISVNKSCCLHVHIMLGQKYTPEILRRISMAVILFEQIMDHHHDYHRIFGNAQINSCFSNPVLKNKTMVQCINIAKNSNDLPSIVNTMNAGDNPMVVHPRKQFKWNFLPITKTFGTIEARQCSGTVNEKVITNWINIVVKFITAATAVPEEQYMEWAAEIDRNGLGAISPEVREKFGAPSL